MLLTLVTKLEDAIVNGKETIVVLNVRLESAEKRSEDVAYEIDGLQACLQQC